MVDDLMDTVYGSISTHFKVSPLSDLCVTDGGIQTGPFGSQLHANDYVRAGTPIITVEHLGDNRIIHGDIPCVSDEDRTRLARYTLMTGDIVFSRVGSVDRRAIVHLEENGWLFSGRCLRIRPNRSKIDPGYLSWFFGLPSFRQYIRRIAVGATMPSLNTKILSDVPIYYPPSLGEQRAIAHILGSLDDKIELNRRMSRTLEGIAQAIFKSWFIDFDPVKAKMDGREPYGLKPEIADLFPSRLVESELGPIPEGWQVVGLLDISNRISGGTPKTSILEYWDGDIEWVSASDVSNHNRSYVVRTARRITQLGLANSSATIVPKNTTVITARGTVGNICLLGRPMAINQTNYGIRAHQGVGDFFVYFTVASEIDTLLSLAYGTIFDTITTATLADIQVVLPQQALLQAFDDIVTPLMGRALLSCQENLILEEIRDTLLPKLISGEIRIPDAERFLEVNT